MAEKFVRTSVSESVKDVVESSIKEVNVEKSSRKGKPGKKDDYKGIVEATLRGVATRIVLTHSFKELGNTLDGALTVVRSGGMDASTLDQLKGRVLDKVKNIKDDRKSEALGKFLEDQFRLGDYEKAVEVLKTMAEDNEIGLSPAEKTETVELLGKVKKEVDTNPAELQELAMKKDEMREKNQEKAKKIVEKSDKIQAEVGREELKVIIANKDVVAVETKKEIDDAQKNLILGELTTSANLSKKDGDFITRVLISDPEIDFLKMDRKVVYHIWYRTSGILGEKPDWTGSEKTQQMLQQMNESSRVALLSFANENLILESMTPSEARWQRLPKEEQDLINGNLGFIEGTNGDFRKLLNYSDGFSGDEFGRHGLEREMTTRTDVAMTQLIIEYSKKKPGFHLEQKLVKNTNTNKWEWRGLSGQSKQQIRKELFDVCRDEVYGIQGQLTQENMGNLIFEESAQKYLALMRIDVGDDLELEKVKDEITKTLYIEFAVKTMWRSGGNMESWQRSAMVLTQDSEENFFQLMDMGEMLKVINKEGKELEIGRFNWQDLMTLAELKASNGQYYLTYMAGQSSALRKERKPEFAAALADILVKKRLLMGEISRDEARDLMVDVQNGGFEFTDRQVRGMVDYMQFLEVATFRGGEFGMNDSTVDGKFNMTSLPCGEVVHKTGPWSLIYDWYYPVTKYGGEFIGKIFLPNVNILSYRRGETLPHFIAKDTKIAAGMLDKTGEYHETGVGAKEFFFAGGHDDEADSWTKFWGNVIFDTRTAQWEGMPEKDKEMAGVNNKTAINRTVDSIREHGSVKLLEWENAGKLGFVQHLDFTNFEMMLGHEIPGKTKMEKFKWMTENFDYSFWRTDIIPSKGVGDWVTKYVPKKYEDTRVKFQALMNAPGTATGGAVRDNISEYSDESTFNGQLQAILRENRKFSLSWRKVDKDGNEDGTKGYDSNTGKKKLVGYKHADRGKSKWIQEGAGDFWGVTEQWHSPAEGYHWGSGFATSRQQGKELFNDPMYFEKMEIDNQFHVGMMSREEWGKAKREWQKKVYLGDAIEIGGKEFRLGYIPLLTPFFLFRGWWVDRMQLDWEDFTIAFHKNNEKKWEELKKIIGI